MRLPLYARHGIPEVWVVDLTHGLVEACRESGTDGYATVASERPGGTLEPVLLPGVLLHAADMLIR